MLTLLTFVVLFCISATSALDEICLEAPNNTIIVDNVDCRVYYVCYNGVARRQRCQNGYFDVTKKRCVPGSNCPPTSDICSGPPDEIHFPHPESCRSYFICANNLILQECNTHEFFDIYKRRCVPGLCPNPICAGKLNRDHVSNPNDFHGYYVCHGGAAYPHKCPKGYFFNGESCYTEQTEVVDFRCIGLLDDSRLKDISDCSRYFICRDGKPFPFTCQSGHYFDDLTKSCISGTCPLYNNNVCAGRPNGTVVNDPSGCERYFLCLAEFPSSYNCRYGYGFDPFTGKCEEEYCGSANICRGKYEGAFVENDHNCQSYFKCQGGTPYRQMCPLDSSFDKTQKRCISGRSNCFEYTSVSALQPGTNYCRGRPNGAFVRDPQDCSKYYTCNHNIAYPGYCGENMFFDDVHFVCNHPQNVRCP